jgi:predicted Zn finger-like uncharacterized protein
LGAAHWIAQVSLVTRCPQCATAFRVDPGQLSARGGKVRCGKCTMVFDGVAQLVGEQPSRLHEPSPQLGLFEPGRAPVRTARPNEGTAARRRLPVAEDDAPVVEFLAEPRPAMRFSVVWSLLAVVALFALFAQLTYHFRTALAVMLPDARPYLAAACDAIGCEVRLPRRPELMGIEGPELQADGQRESVIILNAVLRNRAPFPQEYPALELTLTNATDQAVARRVLLPTDYLRGAGAAELLTQGMAAGGEAVLRVPLETRGLTATGYRLYLFFP